MVIVWNEDGAPDAPADPPKIRAAEYVRMSTEHQQYSTDNQNSAIRRYADQRNFEIVRTYADEGKSGLTVEGRPDLRRMLADIEGGHADFEAILVYDVSRLGRWQDPDEAASYELRCRKAGVPIHYCAEQFENDGSIGSSIIKTVKRAMAGEYSRELSVKVFAGQANLIRRGYRQGGLAGFGLRRLLIDHNGDPKDQLQRGQHKSIATDRVILVPGPLQEVEVVRSIFDRFLEGRSEAEIARDLNAESILTDLDRPWTRGTVHQLLTNEKYVGNNVWARTSFKLKQRHVQNEAGDWVRADNVFAAIVERSIFERAQALIESRADHLSDDEMLSLLKSILDQNGMLSGLVIDEFEGGPSSCSYRSRFGGLLRAYALVGFSPDRDYRYLDINRRLRALYPNVLSEIISGIEAVGGTVAQNLETDVLTVNGEFRASVVIARCLQTLAGSLRWKLRLDTSLRPDLTVAVRMDASNERPLDFYLLPHLDMQSAALRLCEHNGLSLDAYRFQTLDALYRMGARQPFARAA